MLNKQDYKAKENQRKKRRAKMPYTKKKMSRVPGEMMEKLNEMVE